MLFKWFQNLALLYCKNRNNRLQVKKRAGKTLIKYQGKKLYNDLRFNYIYFLKSWNIRFSFVQAPRVGYGNICFLCRCHTAKTKSSSQTCLFQQLKHGIVLNAMITFLKWLTILFRFYIKELIFHFNVFQWKLRRLGKLINRNIVRVNAFWSSQQVFISRSKIKVQFSAVITQRAYFFCERIILYILIHLKNCQGTGIHSKFP